MGVKPLVKHLKVVPNATVTGIILIAQAPLEVEMPDSITHIPTRGQSHFSLLFEVVSLVFIFCELSRIKWLECTVRPPFSC